MHVVHLEDDSPLREVLKVALTATIPNINMKQFSISDEAIKYIEQNCGAIDVLILDIRVPGTLDGLGVARKAREIGCKGMIVITSAYRKPDRALLTTLNSEWMSKPWHITQMIEKLLALGNQKQLPTENP